MKFIGKLNPLFNILRLLKKRQGLSHWQDLLIRQSCLWWNKFMKCNGNGKIYGKIIGF